MIKTLVTGLMILTYSVSNSQGIIDGFINPPKSKTLAISATVDDAKTYYLWNRDLDLPVTSFSISLFYKQQLNKSFGVAANIPLVNLTPQDGTAFLIYGKEKSFKSGSPVAR